jgi:hypothetical protein
MFRVLWMYSKTKLYVGLNMGLGSASKLTPHFLVTYFYCTVSANINEFVVLVGGIGELLSAIVIQESI